MAELAQRVQNVELPAVPPATPTAEVVAQTVGNFCDALKAIGRDWLDWLENRIQAASSDDEDALDVREAVQPTEMLATLERVSVSHAVRHCGAWLSVAFTVAVELERYQPRIALPLQRWHDFYQNVLPAARKLSPLKPGALLFFVFFGLCS